MADRSAGLGAGDSRPRGRRTQDGIARGYGVAQSHPAGGRRVEAPHSPRPRRRLARCASSPGHDPSAKPAHLSPGHIAKRSALGDANAHPNADPFPGETRLRNDNGQASGYSEEWRSGELAGAVLSARPSDYPLRVIGAQFMLHRFKGAAASANVSVVLYSLKPDGAPDRVVGQSSPFPVTTFYADWATVDLRSLQIVVDQPFMLALKYEEGLVGQTPSILTDSNREILPSRNWYSRDGGQTWEEHYDFWKEGSELGYNMIRAIVAPER